MITTKVEGFPGLVRDDTSRAIVATDDTSYQKYMNEAMYRSSLQAETAAFQSTYRGEMDELKQELADIKSLLREMVHAKIG